MTGVRTAWSLGSPSGRQGAIALVHLRGDVDGALHALGVPRVGVGAVALRRLPGVDEMVIARWTAASAHLMPHGGTAVLESLQRAMGRAGLREDRDAGPPDVFPEARSEAEARMLEALASAASPLAIDLLLDQPRRWGLPGASPDPGLDQVLNRLLRPPLVVALGATNIGKSTLCNALAAERVSAESDEPGTTRDAVGVELNLGGLVVHYLDAPGLREPGEGASAEREAIDLAIEFARSADLILRCGDPRTPPPELASVFGTEGVPRDSMAVCLRGDLGGAVGGDGHAGAGAGRPGEITVSVREGWGLAALAEAIRERLVPQEALANPRAWKFW